MSRESSPPQHSVLLIHLHLWMEFPMDFWAGNLSITRGTIPDSEWGWPKVPHPKPWCWRCSEPFWGAAPGKSCWSQGGIQRRNNQDKTPTSIQNTSLMPHWPAPLRGVCFLILPQLWQHHPTPRLGWESPGEGRRRQEKEAQTLLKGKLWLVLPAGSESPSFNPVQHLWNIPSPPPLEQVQTRVWQRGTARKEGTPRSSCTRAWAKP